MHTLGVERPGAADGIQYSTGCTLGQGVPPTEISDDDQREAVDLVSWGGEG